MSLLGHSLMQSSQCCTHKGSLYNSYLCLCQHPECLLVWNDVICLLFVYFDNGSSAINFVIMLFIVILCAL